MRDGTGWHDYLEYDFLVVARVNTLSLASPKVLTNRKFRNVRKVLVQKSNVPNFFEDVGEFSLPPDSAAGVAFNFSEPVIARFVRIVILEVENSHADLWPIGVHK